jgi:hypothetical protein
MYRIYHSRNQNAPRPIFVWHFQKIGCMLRRPFLKHPLRQSILSQLTRPTFRTRSIPLQSRFYAAHPQYKRDHPLWFVATSIVSFAFFFYIVKKKRGLGTILLLNI